MSKEFNILGLTVESIKNDNLEVLDKALRIMPLEKMKDEDTLLTTFLALCAAYNRAEASKMVLERWKVVYPDNDKIPLFSRLFLKRGMNNSTLSYLVSIHPEYTYVELMDDLAEFDASQEVMIACARAEKIFGEQPHSTYQILREHAQEFDNFIVEEYMVGKMEETASYASVPKYMQNHVGEYFPQYKETLPTTEEVYALAEEESQVQILDLPSDEKAVEMLTQGLSRYGISFEEEAATKEFIRQQVASSEEMKRQLVTPLLRNEMERELETDRLLFWTFGPSNPLVGQDLTIDAPSYKYGGCRMFLTDLFDYDEENEFLADWFTGNCQHCLLKIRERRYSVRHPRSMGGWTGCYCSWKCVRDAWMEREEDKDLLTEKLIEIFGKKMEEIGIQSVKD
tara:strand:+ start:1776 stop:2966 length:1191 start_codon:yes stop_codon:yes gene_type:complete